MLSGAVRKYEQQQTTSPSAVSEAIANTHSSPLQRTASQNLNRGFKNPFNPTPASALNGLNGSQQRAQRAAGVKRTSSGLAKTFEGSFEDAPGSQHRPIALEHRSPAAGKIVQVTATEYIDENDFDSDVDLDFEEPKAAAIASYPALPQQKTPRSPIRPILYPTLPRQQQAQTSFARHAGLDSGTKSFASAMSPPRSSATIPWSSSPAEHLNPVASPSTLDNGHGQYQSIAAAMQGPSAPPATQAPARKRTLPWKVKPAATPAATVSSTNHTRLAQTVTAYASSTDNAVRSTPKENKTAYLWNTSASAVKEQQKQHREQFKKPSVISKINEADETAIVKAKSNRERPAKVFLSEEQQHVLNLVCEKNKSVFFTGSAGTGKSVLMREIISSFRRKYQREPDRVAVTASTGLAACNVGGVTLHSFAGIGLGKEDVPTLVKKIRRNQKARHRWMRTKVLVVDEVSMVDGDLFDKLEAVARQIRSNGRPFGGIQLVITGDFFQLPPVPDSGRVAKFAFDAATWSTSVEHTIGLHHVFRQKDPVFASMLNEMREGRLSQASIAAFQKLTRPLKFEDMLECTELYPRREEVERANWDRLHSLQGQPYVFDARDGGAIADKGQRDKLLSNCMAPESITLKKGAQVMLIKNVDEGLVNGSIGQVMGLMDEQQFDRYSNIDSKVEDTSTDDNGANMPSNNSFDSFTTARRWPVVRFLQADGTTRDLLCQPETWKVEQPNGEVQASRLQIPLILAWALSIHKAQGQTLDRVKVDLGKVFEKGQAYVALSRATSMNGLQVLRFDPKKVVAHERVRHFYSNLSRIELDAQKRKSDTSEKSATTKGGLSAKDFEKAFMNEVWDDGDF